MAANRQVIDFGDNPDWMEDALCATIPNARNLFFLDWKGGNGVHTYKQARKICFQCPVRVECLEWELAIEEQTGKCEGMFGGRSPIERRAMIKRRKKGTNGTANKG